MNTTSNLFGDLHNLAKSVKQAYKTPPEEHRKVLQTASQEPEIIPKAE